MDPRCVVGSDAEPALPETTAPATSARARLSNGVVPGRTVSTVHKPCSRSRGTTPALTNELLPAPETPTTGKTGDSRKRSISSSISASRPGKFSACCSLNGRSPRNEVCPISAARHAPAARRVARVGHDLTRRRPALGLLGQTAVDERREFQRKRRVSRQLADGSGAADLGRQLERREPRVGTFAHRQLVQDHAQRPDIGRRRRWLAAPLFREPCRAASRAAIRSPPRPRRAAAPARSRPPASARRAGPRCSPGLRSRWKI